ncbi:beta-lactamase family protein [Spiractinospora alimapuensis]|uniref:serine hydrolase domain-containing protein n=1 Tax=Spiractinospora alimapuensis TaxID=2820884 RepID=UPI001F36289B|nr:serine hydrolase domain-containing protein [Spiractinospora alimapuensis]QVQ54194.1 beta-lactamase family protein [Spiractinospora alimapuensis]
MAAKNFGRGWYGPPLLAVPALVLLVPLGCAVGGPETIQPFLDEELPDGSSGTLVAAIGDEKILCHAWGQADREAATDATCDTVYDTMSMTKQFTAAGILALQSQGELGVSDSITDHLDSVPTDQAEITIDQLLTHTSRLPESLGRDEEPLTRDELVARAFTAERLESPGDTYQYSNVGYSLLALIIEEASGMTYEEYLAENLFEPAGMTDTGYVLPDWSEDQVAVEYDEEGQAQGRPYERPWDEDGPYWNLHGNGGLLSTAHDMFRWHVALMGDTVLDTEAKEQLFLPTVREEPDSTYYAYGWGADSEDSDVLWHDGGNDYSSGWISRQRDGDAFVFWVSNASRSDAWDLGESGEDITDGVMRRLANAEDPPPSE